MLEFIVPAHTPPLTVKDFLKKCALSLNLRRKIKHHGSIICNNQPLGWNDLLADGDIILVSWPSGCTIDPIALDLVIQYEDESILVVDKPAGLLVHPTSGKNETTLANAVLHYYQSTGQSFSFHPVHRLDRQTSGLLVIAKNSYIHHRLSGNGIKHLNRVYQAIVAGLPNLAKGTIDTPITRKPGSIIERITSTEGQSAITDYQVISGNSCATLAEITLHTGRTHQIRVHFSSIGHPLLGDDLYGGSTSLISRQALHATKLSFVHPVHNKTISITSPLPPDMITVLQHLALKNSE